MGIEYELKFKATPEAFAALVKKEPESRLLLVGEGIQMTACVARAEELGITDKVLFLGIRSDIPDLLQAMDVSSSVWQTRV